MPASRPIIGITTQTLEAIPDELPRCWVMSQRYVQAMAESGGVPWIIPLMPDDPDTMRRIYEQLDGLLLPGGVDIDPRTYGASRLEGCGRTDIDRDRAEVMLTRWAMDDGKPVLGICRGVQLINVAAGGTLYQDVAAEMPGAIKHDYFPHGGTNPRDQLVHEVAVAPTSRLAALLEEQDTMVNSMHHQGIKSVPPSLVASAHAPDGLVEGLESNDDAFLFGVQWHPEDLTHADWHMRRLFAGLLDAGRAWRSSAIALAKVVEGHRK